MNPLPRRAAAIRPAPSSKSRSPPCIPPTSWDSSSLPPPSILAFPFLKIFLFHFPGKRRKVVGIYSEYAHPNTNYSFSIAFEWLYSALMEFKRLSNNLYDDINNITNKRRRANRKEVVKHDFFFSFSFFLPICICLQN